MKTVKPGIYPSTRRAEYDTWDALNISLLVEGTRSMAHLRWRMDSPEEATPDLVLGTATHLAVFEPSEFEKSVACQPKVDGRTKEGKAAKEEFLQQNAGKLIVSGEQHNCAVRVRDACWAHPVCRELLQAPGQVEVSFVWVDQETGILCKGRTDRFCRWRGYSAVPDLKTCGNAAPDEFARAVARYHYHIKAAWYLDGLSAIHVAERRFIWIAAEKDEPNCVALYEPEDQTLSEGRKIYRRLLRQYANCQETGIWPGYGDGIEPLQIPKWSFERLEVLA